MPPFLIPGWEQWFLESTYPRWLENDEDVNALYRPVNRDGDPTYWYVMHPTVGRREFDMIEALEFIGICLAVWIPGVIVWVWFLSKVL